MKNICDVLERAGAAPRVITDIIEIMSHERTETRREIARAFYNSGDGESVMTRGDFGDEMYDLVRRIDGLDMAFDGLREATCDENDSIFDGVNQILTDIRQNANRLAETFAAMGAEAEDRKVAVADPIFGAIAERNRLEAVHLAAIAEVDDLTKAGAHGRQAAQQAQDDACEEVADYEREILLQTAPTTPAGAVALLRTVAELAGSSNLTGRECGRAILAAVSVLDGQ